MLIEMIYSATNKIGSRIDDGKAYNLYPIKQVLIYAKFHVIIDALMVLCSPLSIKQQLITSSINLCKPVLHLILTSCLLA